MWKFLPEIAEHLDDLFKFIFDLFDVIPYLFQSGFAYWLGIACVLVFTLKYALKDQIEAYNQKQKLMNDIHFKKTGKASADHGQFDEYSIIMIILFVLCILFVIFK